MKQIQDKIRVDAIPYSVPFKPTHNKKKMYNFRIYSIMPF